MPYAYLISAVALVSVLSLLGSGYNKKNANKENITTIYNLLLCSASCVSWAIIYAFDFSFEPKALLYSLGFGVCYAIVIISLTKSLACGPTSITALIQQLSLIGATIWGFIFWSAPVTPFVIIEFAKSSTSFIGACISSSFFIIKLIHWQKGRTKNYSKMVILRNLIVYSKRRLYDISKK